MDQQISQLLSALSRAMKAPVTLRMDADNGKIYKIIHREGREIVAPYRTDEKPKAPKDNPNSNRD